MSTLTLAEPRNVRSDAGTYEFFVSTTGCAGDLKRHLGSADYSYGFVLRALAPALEALGSWRLIELPESRLPYLAEQTRAQGASPFIWCFIPAIRPTSWPESRTFSSHSGSSPGFPIATSVWRPVRTGSA